MVKVITTDGKFHYGDIISRGRRTTQLSWKNNPYFALTISNKDIIKVIWL